MSETASETNQTKTQDTHELKFVCHYCWAIKPESKMIRVEVGNPDEYGTLLYCVCENHTQEEKQATVDREDIYEYERILEEQRLIEEERNNTGWRKYLKRIKKFFRRF